MVKSKTRPSTLVNKIRRIETGVSEEQNKGNKQPKTVGVYLRGPGSIQYGGRPRDSMCILVATVKIIPTTSRVCHLLQLGVRSEEPSWENDASKMCVYMPLKE